MLDNDSLLLFLGMSKKNLLGQRGVFSEARKKMDLEIGKRLSQM
tara:strand:- start:847 stop:978 length:132 start_codon:yes stop_codon:yes gene_type:complete